MHVSFFDVGQFENITTYISKQRSACILTTPSIAKGQNLGGRGLSLSGALKAITNFFAHNEPHFKEFPDLNLDDLGVVLTRDHAYVGLQNPIAISSLLKQSEKFWFGHLQKTENLLGTTHIVFRFTLASDAVTHHQILRRMTRQKQDKDLLSRRIPVWPKDDLHPRLAEHLEKCFKETISQEQNALFRKMMKREREYDREKQYEQYDEYRDKWPENNPKDIPMASSPEKTSSFFGSFDALFSGLTNIKFK